MNILLSSAGRRGSLIKILKATLKDLKVEGKIFACDCAPEMSVACHLADESVKVPRVTDSNYKGFILGYCVKNEIKIIIPTIDPELLFYSENIEVFRERDIYVVVSDKSFCEIFNLKTRTFDFFNQNNIRTPQIVKELKSANYPLFAKLDNSSRSVGAQIVYSFDQAEELLDKSSDYVFQELILGDEYTVDLYLSRKGQPISIVPRKRIEVRSGEVSKGIAVKNDLVIDSIKSICPQLVKSGAIGPQTIQVFLTPNQEVIFIEINPRFGGGYPLSYFAGSNFFKYIVAERMGEEIKPDSNWRDNTLMLRYDSEVIVYDSCI